MRDPQDRGDYWRQLGERARVEGREVWLEILQDRATWNESPTWAQDQCFEAVEERLGEIFCFTGAEIFQCGGQRHRIGGFRYLGLSRTTPYESMIPLDLQLIPGGELRASAGGDFHYFSGGDLEAQRIPPLLVGASCVTEAQWRVVGFRFMGGDPQSQRPVAGADLDEMEAWMSEARGGFRLPREAEWEFACRAGTETAYSFGDEVEELSHYAWFEENSGDWQNPVGRKLPNAFGLYDMHGNVWEECIYNGDPSKLPEDTRADSLRRGSSRLHKGGSFFDAAIRCQSSSRLWGSWGGAFCGFRVFRDVR